MAIEFKPFPKIPRMNRDVIFTEKIDGTNACIVVSDDGKEIGAQSRNRVITVHDDNYGFANWVEANREDLLRLGPGYHYGEWWGRGIGRNYGHDSREFALFNTARWHDGNPNRPACCGVVPVLGTGHFGDVQRFIELLRLRGSVVRPGFMNPEGVIGFHTASGSYFKATLEKDDEWKGKTQIAIK